MGKLGSIAGGAAAGAAIGSFVPVIGTAIGGLIGGSLGAISSLDAETVDPSKQSYESLPWYDRAATTIGAKLEGVGNSAAGLLGFEDAFGTELQDAESALKYKRSDSVGSSLANSGNISVNNLANNDQNQSAQQDLLSPNNNQAAAPADDISDNFSF